MFATVGQARIFLATVYAGLFTGLLYDALSVPRRLLKPNRTLAGAIDLLFWVAAAVVFTVVTVMSGGDGLRGYMLLGFCSGLVIYWVGIHFILRVLAKNIVKFIRGLRKRLTFIG